MKKFYWLKKMSGVLAGMILLLLLADTAHANDVLQWRNNRDGIYTETGLLKSWPENGPKMLWVNESLGEGYSSPVIVKGKIYVTGVDGKSEFLSCLDLQGKELWRTTYAPGWQKSYPEARTTPTWVDETLYVISGCGVAAAIDAASGKLLWKSDVWAKYGGDPGRWGISESPLVFDGKVICTPTGEQTTVVALNAKDGSLAWKSPSLKDQGAYVSPLLIEHNGKKQIIAVGGIYIMGVAPQTGKIEWSFNYNKTFFDNDGNPQRWVINCNTPVYKDGYVFVTSGYDHAGVMLELNADATAAKLVYKTDVIDTHHGHVVEVGGYIYGSNWINNSNGNWACIEWKTGKKMYEAEWENKGPIIYADGMLYCYDEKRGNLALVEATPTKFNIISSFRITHGTKSHWGHPVISHGIMYVRRGNALMAFDIKAVGK